MPRRHFSSFKERGVAEIESEDSDDIEIRLRSYNTGFMILNNYYTEITLILYPHLEQELHFHLHFLLQPHNSYRQP